MGCCASQQKKDQESKDKSGNTTIQNKEQPKSQAQGNDQNQNQADAEQIEMEFNPAVKYVKEENQEVQVLDENNGEKKPGKSEVNMAYQGNFQS